MADLRRALNSVARKYTGYQVVRATPSDPAPASPPPSHVKPGPSRRERRLARELATHRRKQRREAKARRMHDPEAHDVIDTVKPRTMTGYDKLYGLVLACRYVARHEVPGDIVECGVWRGGSMQAIALTLLAAGEKSRHLHLYDTFEGMPPPSQVDRRVLNGRPADQLLQENTREHPIWAVADLDDVRQGMSEIDYPSELIHFHPGMVEQTIPDQAPPEIALLRLDTDWYESTKHELEHLYPRLSPGGVLIIDDYGDWEGARKAVDEYVAALDDPLLLLPLGRGRIAVKPR
jgi:hypothetical protein